MSAAGSLSATTKRTIARIRRLCCLGLGGETIMPALLAELHALVPSHSNQFFWAGPNQELTNFYSEGDLQLSLPLYLNEFHGKRELEVNYSFTEVMRRSRYSDVMDYRQRMLKVEERAFRRHDYYNTILRPNGLDHCLQLKVAEHGRPLGLLHISRQYRDSEFDGRAHRLVEWIAPFVAHALAPGSTDGQWTASGDRGLVIAAPSGQVQFLSPEARHLLALTASPGLPSHSDHVPEPGTMLPPVLVQLCRDLVSVFEDKESSAAPVRQIRNRWGAFTFRAYRLDGAAGSQAPGLIGITIERLEPLALKLWRRAEELPLTGRELEVALPLALGKSRAEIAERLGVSENTAINHCRNIYAKLGVQSRAELVQKLEDGSAVISL
jgi:DNA-binding CsgD family transcriptional regulator